jgi:hypothetical protein
VFEGTEPEPFDVEVIGVLPDGISVGLDLILVKASGAAIDEIGGIASGFSGSPVYVDGILAGAISYGFWYGDPTIGGMTPAEPIVEILSYPGAGELSAAATAAMAPPERIRLDARTSRAVARAADLSSDVGRLTLPLSASGVGERGLQKLQARFDRKGLPFVPYVGSSARRPTAATLSTTPLEPGDAFAVVVSYGDVTYGAVGTATAVCGDRVVAFGHPFDFAGAVDDLSMQGANVLTIVTDPSQAYRPFKIAILAEHHGLIDQDRMAGVRGVEARLPSTTRIRTETSSSDVDRTRVGTTHIVKQDHWLRWVAWDHVWMNIDRTWDQIGPGMLAMDWTIHGLRASGLPFELSRSNMYWSDWDNSWDNTEEFYYHLYALQENRFEDVEITGIDAVAVATEERHEARIKKVLTASSLQPELGKHDPLLVTPGETIGVRVMLLPLGADVPVPVDLQVRIPKRALPGRGTCGRAAGRPTSGACGRRPSTSSSPGSRTRSATATSSRRSRCAGWAARS